VFGRPGGGAQLSRVGLRRTDKQLEGAGRAQLFEIDLASDQVAQRIQVKGLELRRRKVSGPVRQQLARG
jgi:hypothetical protein